MQLTPDQAAVADELEAFCLGQSDEEVATLAGYAGVGKEQPVSAIVQTPTGPRRFGDLKVGDKVMGRHGRPTIVTGVYSQGVKPVYEVTFRDGAKTRCGIEHLWHVGRRSHGKFLYETLSLREIIERGLFTKNATPFARFKIPLCEPVHFENPFPRFDPYVIGALIGDGYICGSVVSLSNPDIDSDISDSVRETLEPLEFEVRRNDYGSCPRYVIADPGNPRNRLRQHLVEVGLAVKSVEKHIPSEYLYAPVEARKLLLAGLMDTDASSGGNRIRFSTSSARLASDIVTLVQSLGGTAIKHSRERNGEVEFDVNVKTTFNPFRTQRKAKNWKPSWKNPPSRYIVVVEEVGEEEQMCIRVDAEDHLYLTDEFIVTHNTTVVAEVVHRLPLERMRVVVAAPTHKALAVLGDKLGSTTVELATLHSLLGLKLSNKDDGTQIVVDENKNSSLHEFALAIVDEASMVSAGLFEAVLTKRQRCRVLFVGDPAQLAPVDGDGELSPTFGPLVPRHWCMTQVVRQAQDNPIIRLATVARGCIEEACPFTLHALGAQLVGGDDGFLAVQPGGTQEIARLVADAIQHGQDTRALAWDNATVQRINICVHAMVYPGQGEYPAGTRLIANESMTATDCQGAPPRRVPVRNSALLTVLGSELRSHPDERSRKAWRLEVEADGGQPLECWVAENQKQLQVDISDCFAEYRRLKLREQMASCVSERQALREQARSASDAGWVLRARYAPLRYAYALTVHKAQGSTFDAVVLDWASFERCRDVQQRNRLIYVALTRTRRFAVVCA